MATTNDSCTVTPSQEWGAIKNIAQLDAILAACKTLEDDEQPLNRENVATLSGVTSNNLLATGLALYKARANLRNLVPETSATLVEMICIAADQKFKEMKGDFKNAVEAEKVVFAESLDVSVAHARGLEIELEQLSTRLADQADQIKHLSSVEAEHMTTIGRLTNERDAIKGDYERVVMKADRLDVLLAETKKALALASERHKKELQDLRTLEAAHREDIGRSHQKAIDAIMVKNDEAETRYKNEVIAQKKELAALGEKLLVSKDEQAKSLEENAGLKGRIKALSDQQSDLIEHAKVDRQEWLDRNSVLEQKLEDERGKAKQRDVSVDKSEMAMVRMLAMMEERFPQKPEDDHSEQKS